MSEESAPLVLWVGGDREEAETAARALEGAGWRVESCRDAAEALERLGDPGGPRPAAVLLDVDPQADPASEALDRLLVARGDALREERDRARRASRAQSAFVAAMSHEIRTPLNAILGMADLLARTPLDLEQRQYVEIFRRCGRALKGLLDNALELSRIETGALRLHEGPFELGPQVDECLEACAYAAHRKDVAVVGDVDDAVAGTARGDDARLRQVLVNLLGNAVKFTEAGRVLLRARPAAAGIEVEVIDTGVGIAPERQAAIFERFVQAEPDTSRRFGGSGLGLALSREIAEAMGGRLSVESEPGRGSRFRLALPLPVSPRAPRPGLDGERVLAVMGDAVEREVLARRLRARGAEVVEADSVASGRDALQADPVAPGRDALDAAPFTALLVDARLPGGGVALFECGEAPPPDAARRVVLLPMDHRVGDLARCEALGATALCKPLRWDELDAALRGGPVHGTDRRLQPPAPRYPGARVLLAEDAAESRTVALAHLAPTGCAVEVAVDGEEAVARVEQGGIDLLLLDVHMPRLDGCEVARRIRAWEDSRGAPRTAIVALTAEALPERRAAILEAGCDAHLSKPFGREDLHAVLGRFLTGREDEEEAMDDETGAAERYEIPPELADLAEDYLGRRRADAESLRGAAREGRFDDARRLGHNMKGSGGGYGFARISELGAEIQYASEGRDPDELERLARELDDYARKALAALAQA